MDYRVVVKGSGHQFAVAPDESILEAALRQGVNLPYGCRNGACGACKAEVTAGSVDLDGAELSALGEDERAQGFALLCCARPLSDVEIVSREFAAAAIPARTLPTRIEAMDRLAPDVMRLRLKIPANERLQFVAGQYVDIILKDGSRRSFSIANAPHDDALIELHVRHVPGGVFTDQLFSTIKERDILRIHGPLGSFCLDEASTRPILCIAGGTGFAPLKAIVEHALHTGCTRPIAFYWGARDRAGLYAAAVAEAWQRAHASVRFVPVLSDASPGDGWAGRRGLVHLAALDELGARLGDHDVYVCGAPAMVAAARTDFTGRGGLPADRFFADAFSFAHQ